MLAEYLNNRQMSMLVARDERAIPARRDVTSALPFAT
jgi:hypothetical protein